MVVNIIILLLILIFIAVIAAYAYLALIVGIVAAALTYIAWFRPIKNPLRKIKLTLFVFVVVTALGLIVTLFIKGPPHFSQPEVVTWTPPADVLGCETFADKNKDKNGKDADYYFNVCVIKLSEETSNYTLCASSRGESSADTCYHYFALFKKEQAACSLIANVAKKDQCYFSISTATGNTSLCKSINATSTKSQCLNWKK